MTCSQARGLPLPARSEVRRFLNGDGNLWERGGVLMHRRVASVCVMNSDAATKATHPGVLYGSVGEFQQNERHTFTCWARCGRCFLPAGADIERIRHSILRIAALLQFCIP